MDWSKSIRPLRDRLGLTVAEFAEILDVSASSVYTWEAGTSEPQDCEKALISFIDENQKAAEHLLSIPITETGETPSERLRRVRGNLGLSRERFARLLRVHPATINYWEENRGPIRGCALRLLDFLEFHMEEAAPYFWPQLIKSKPEKADHREPCTRFMDLLSKTQGEGLQAVLQTLKVESEWEPERVIALRNKLGLSAIEFSELLGISIGTLSTFENDGLKTVRSRCWRTLLALFERYPEAMMETRMEWPEFI